MAWTRTCSVRSRSPIDGKETTHASTLPTHPHASSCSRRCRSRPPILTEYFDDATLRVDFYQYGNAESEHIAVDRLVKQGPWAGPIDRLLDPHPYGGYVARADRPGLGRDDLPTGFRQPFRGVPDHRPRGAGRGAGLQRDDPPSLSQEAHPAHREPHLEPRRGNRPVRDGHRSRLGRDRGRTATGGSDRGRCAHRRGPPLDPRHRHHR